MKARFQSENLKGRDLGRLGSKWENNMRLDVKKYFGVDWIHQSEDRDQWRDLLNNVMNFRVP
jgi:hypothetical protein